ncbi:MAG: tetratricopeptide repeat protein [Planctomycetota bacterium]
MRTLLNAAIVGALLSMMRVPLGVDLTQWAAVDPRAAYGVRALALLLAALGTWNARGVRTGWFAALALGFAVHALLVARVWSPASVTELWIVWVLAVPALLWPRSASETPPQIDEPRPRLLEMFGLAICGGGVALVLEGVARHLRLFGAGLAQDDSLFALVLVAWIAIGALSFGWLAASTRPGGIALPVCLALAAAGGYASFRVVTSIATSRGLDTYIRRFNLDTSLHGMWKYDALLAASCFVVPALLIGAALSGSKRRERWSSPVLGAAVGVFLVPAILARDPGAVADERELFSAHLIPIGTLTAVAGAVVAIFAHMSSTARARGIALAPLLAAALLPAFVRVDAQFVLAPWRVMPVIPDLVFESPAGLITIEPTRGGLAQATLDRRAITPDTETADDDVQRLMLSVDALPSAVRVRPALRVLLVGQLTPIRSVALLDVGAGSVDRTGAWWESMPRIEAALFGATALPPGEIVAPADARRRIADGRYDLVLALPVEGDAPVPVNLDVPNTTTLVAWAFLDQPLPRRDFGQHVMLYADGLESPTMALLRNAGATPSAEPTSPLIVDPGTPVRTPTPFEWLGLRKFERTHRAHTLAAQRFANAAHGTLDQDLTAGMASFYAAQVHSSQFETREQQTELPADCLELFRSTALARTPNVFVRKLWEELAEILVGKRWIEEIFRYVQPIAERYAPWPTLEFALARAEIEALDASSARARLEQLSRAHPLQPQYTYWLGRVQRDGGDLVGAAHSWRRVRELAPDDSVVRRELAIVLLRLGEPEGRRLAEEILRASPDDEEMQALLEGREYVPSSSDVHDGHDH